MSKIKETKQVKKENKVKTWIGDHKGEIIIGGLYTVAGVVCVVMGVKSHKKNKSIHELWKQANDAWKAGNKDHDFGPYKVMRILEPVTEEVIGDVMCHETTCDMFLKLNKES